MMDGCHVTLVVGSGTDTMHRHRPEVTGLELLLARGLHLDRILPIERLSDFDDLPGRVVRRAGVQAERTPGVRDKHPDFVLVDPGGARRSDLRVDRRLGARPDFEDAVVAHPAYG